MLTVQVSAAGQAPFAAPSTALTTPNAPPGTHSSWPNIDADEARAATSYGPKNYPPTGHDHRITQVPDPRSGGDIADTNSDTGRSVDPPPGAATASA